MNLSILCNKIPSEIIFCKIKPYVISTCSKCSKEELFDDVTLNVYLKKYVSVFDDNFYIVTPNSLFFKVLCNRCHFKMMKEGYYPILYKKHLST